VVTQLIDTVTDKLFSNICVSNNATPLADCATVGGGFSNGMCFESITDVTPPNDISIKIVGYENHSLLPHFFFFHAEFLCHKIGGAF
jgi:hypothetical protein